jgi:hypothetical protein
MASRHRYPPWKKSTPIRQIASLPSATHTGFYRLASQLPPRDGSAQALLRPHKDGLLHSNQKKGVSMSSTLSPTRSKFSPKWVIPSLEISAQNDLKNARLSSKPLSLGRAIFRFVIAFGLGVAVTSGWQSHGDAAREMIANWSEQFGWLAPAPDAHASRINAPTAVVVPSPDVAGQEQMARDITQLQAAEQDVLQKISEPLPSSPAAPTPSQVAGGER